MTKDDKVEVITYYDNLIEKITIGDIPYKIIFNRDVLFENKELKPVSKKTKKWFESLR